MPATASPSPAELSAHIRHLRIAQGLGLADFAKRAGLEPSMVEAMEAGISDFTLEQLLAIGRGLGMQTSAVFRSWEVGACSG